MKDRIWRRIVRTSRREESEIHDRGASRGREIGGGRPSVRCAIRIPGLDVLPVGVDRTSHETAPVERSRVPAPAAPVRRVALLTGCVADAVRPDITRAAVEVLRYNGVEVIPVPNQTCCGALALHGGETERARESARANVEAFRSANVDFIVSTASGCGLIMREYETLLAGDSLAAEAARIAAKVRDVTEVLVEVGVAAPRTRPDSGRVLYHDACHLLHGAGVTDAPRKVLEIALGRPVDDLGENHLCCGSAGTYNVEHPKMAKTLGDRKAELTADAEIVAVGNVGCMLQIKAALERKGSTARTVHPLELLADAYAAGDD